MEISGKIFKDGNFWLSEIPLLDLIIQSKIKKEMPKMIKDAIELLVDDSDFKIKVDVSNDNLFISANDIKKLIGLILKRLRLKNQLKLEDIANNLNSKSINDYAQYEQAKHLPSFEKLEQFLDAIDPKRVKYPIYI